MFYFRVINPNPNHNYFPWNSDLGLGLVSGDHIAHAPLWQAYNTEVAVKAALQI